MLQFALNLIKAFSHDIEDNKTEAEIKFLKVVNSLDPSLIKWTDCQWKIKE